MDFALSLEKAAAPVSLNDVGSVLRGFCMISLAKHASLVTFKKKKLLSKLLAGIERYSDGSRAYLVRAEKCTGRESFVWTQKAESGRIDCQVGRLG